VKRKTELPEQISILAIQICRSEYLPKSQRGYSEHAYNAMQHGGNLAEVPENKHGFYSPLIHLPSFPLKMATHLFYRVRFCGLKGADSNYRSYSLHRHPQNQRRHLFWELDLLIVKQIITTVPCFSTDQTQLKQFNCISMSRVWSGYSVLRVMPPIEKKNVTF
jgi:hypothetical protein